MMKFLVILFLAFVSALAVTNYKTGRIEDGHEAKLGQFPWQAAIHVLDSHNNNNYRCLGVLLDKSHVLTTDKCLTDNEIGKGVVSVHLGVIIASKDDNAKKVISATRDPTANLAVLKIEDVVLSSNIRGIKVSATDEVADGSLGRSSGWGSDNHFIHQMLQFDDKLDVTFDSIDATITSSTNPHHACLWDQGTGLITFDTSSLHDILSGIAQKNFESCEGDTLPPSKYISTFQNKNFINAALQT